MTLDRRSFLRWTSAAGLAVATAPRWSLPARAAGEPFAGPFWLTIHAGGGWDPTLLCDPKGRASEAEVDPVNTYGTDEIVQVGAFKLAPTAGVEGFFQRWGSEVLVLNGIDTQTNSHEVGTRFTWSGSMDMGGPAVNAMVAGSVPAGSRPSLAYLAHDGYDQTSGLVAATRLPDTSAVRRIAYPDRLDPNDPESTLLPPDLMERLVQAREARLQRQLDAASLPRVQRSIQLLQEARSGKNDLAELARILPQSPVDSDNGLIRQAETALACFQAGVSASASLGMGGFDTHGNHDAEHAPRITEVVEALDWIYAEAERRGLADKLFVVVGSDFARTPWYNENNGKDHWSITSMLVSGPSIRGGRVVGATDDRQTPLLLDPNTLRPAESGIRITPAEVHGALRQVAGLAGSELDARFGVGTALPLWT